MAIEVAPQGAGSNPLRTTEPGNPSPLAIPPPKPEQNHNTPHPTTNRVLPSKAAALPPKNPHSRNVLPSQARNPHSKSVILSEAAALPPKGLLLPHLIQPSRLP